MSDLDEARSLAFRLPEVAEQDAEAIAENPEVCAPGWAPRALGRTLDRLD